MSLKDYSLANPKTTGDTIWIDYNAPMDEPMHWYVGDIDRALAYWSNQDNLTEVERWAIWQSIPRPNEPQMETPAVDDQDELFDAIHRFTLSRKLMYERQREDKRKRKQERKRRKQNQPAQLSLW